MWKVNGQALARNSQLFSSVECGPIRFPLKMFIQNKVNSFQLVVVISWIWTHDEFYTASRRVIMNAFEWGMFGLWLFFTAVFAWSLYSYRASKMKSKGQQSSD